MTTEPGAEGEYVSPATLPGAIIDEKYRVDGVIGRGGVGLVVVATHLAMSQRVAIKMIRDDVPMQRELLDRFHREARAAAMIRSEHVARVLDVGRLPTGRPYIVMEYLEGEDLERVVSRGAVPWMTAVDLSLQACEALAEAHRAGIVHRDLKPANLFLTRRADGAPLVKVLDFGISKIQPLTAERVGRGVETTSIMGSPGYMAPEQMKSTRDVDARADVWSLGTVLYEMLVGKPAFEGATMIEILNAIAECSPPPPSHRQVGIPPGLDDVVARCLTKEPEDRWSCIADLAVALQPFASPAGAGLADRAVKISQEAPPVLEEPQFAVLRSEPRPSAVTVMTPARQKVLWRRIGIAAVAAVTVGVVATVALRGRAPEAAGDSFPSALAASPVPQAPPSTEATAVPAAAVVPVPWAQTSPAPSASAVQAAALPTPPAPGPAAPAARAAPRAPAAVVHRPRSSSPADFGDRK